MSHPIPKRLVQVAGVTSLDEAHMLMEEGADWLGFPLHLDVHEPDLTDEDAAVVIGAVHKPHRAALITYLDTADEVAALANVVGASVVQLHGTVSSVELQKLRGDHPELLLIKSLVIRPDDTFQTHESVVDVLAMHVDAFITDSFDPDTGASGATGRTHDWSISQQLVAYSSRPVILAGGLTSENVAAAIETVRPVGVDVHTGVEDSNGRKSRERVKAFVSEARAGFASL